MANGKKRQGKRKVSLGDDFGPAVVRVNGFVLTTGGDGKAILEGPDGTLVTLEPVASRHTGHKDRTLATVTKHAFAIGDVLPDGWVVGPVSPTTGVVMAIEPVSGALDGDGYKAWYVGEDHAKELHAQGHAGVRQPDADELNALYNGIVKAGHNQHAQFNTSGSVPFGLYWSSTTHPASPGSAKVQYFEGGGRYWDFKDGAFARVRCVRDEPGLTLTVGC